MPVNIYNMTEVIEDFLILKIRERYPNIDLTPNSPVMDLTINPLKQIISQIVEKVNELEFMSNLANASLLTNEQMDHLASGNYFLSRKSGSKALGVITLKLRAVSENTNFVIPIGATFATKSGLQYKTITRKEVNTNELLALYNPSSFMYEIPVSVEAELEGAQYNVGNATITEIITNFDSNISSVTNPVAMSGGKDQETNEEFANRVSKFYISRQLGTGPGYSSFILENFAEVKDIYVAGKNDPLMQRDLITVIVSGQTQQIHIGGKVDLYIRGVDSEITTVNIIAKTNRLPLSNENINTNSIVVTNLTHPSGPLQRTIESNPETGIVTVVVPEVTGVSTIQWELGNSLRVVYEHTPTGGSAQSATEEFIVDRTEGSLFSPVKNVISIYNQSQNMYYDLAQPNVFEIIHLNAGFEGTSKELAKIRVLKPELNNGESLVIAYNYNKTINSMSLLFNQQEHRIVTTDILIKEATPIYVHIGIQVKLKEGQSPDSLKEALLRNIMINYISALRMGEGVEESELISAFYKNEAVSAFLEYVSLPLETFYKTSNASAPYTEGVRNATYLTINKIEYPVLQASAVKFL